MNFGSILPLEVQSLTSPQDYLVPNKPRKVVSANHKSKLHIKGFLEVGDLSGWKGAGLRNSHPNKHNQITSYHMPIIHPNSKSLLDLTKDLPNFNNVSERLLSSGKPFHSNGSKENHTNQLYTKDKSFNASTGGNNNHDGSANKSKVPDIQMINKYYGLIPKKFTVHSRQSGSSQRNSKSHGTMPHASRSKSAHPFGTGSRKKLGHLGSSKSLDISEDETNEPQRKISVRLRRGNSLDLTGSLAEETEGGSKSLMAIGKNSNGCNNVSLVTKKIPVEKQKKWNKSGSLLRSSSLSSMDEDRHRHAREKSIGDNHTDGNTEIQRVIKIDLNNMSWEESFQSCYSPFEEPQSTRESSPVPEKVYSTAIKRSANDMCPLLSSAGSEGNSSGGGWTTSVNSSESGSCSISSGGGGCGSPSSLSLPGDSPDIQSNREQANTHACIDYDEEAENLKERESVLNDGESYCRTPTTLPLLSVIGTDDNALRTTIDESSTNRTNTNSSSYTSSGNGINEGESPIHNMPVGGESPSRMDGRNNESSSSVLQGLESRRARMRKTISFDEQILRNKESNVTTPIKHEPEAVKIRRPTTAASGSRQAANPPSVGPKVAPWTQKSGKNLSLSERRSKFQKSVSIHSTAESFDYGEGEGSDCDTDFTSNIKATYSPPAAFTPNPKSSVYRDTSRKPLFFQPAPEVSTMISQISPIDNLEIQCEIEKVAIMLKNMQNQNKSFIDLTPAAAFISQNTHLTTNTRAGNPTPLIKESDLLSQTSNNNTTVKDTQDINGNPMNANKNHLADGNNVTLHAFNNNGPGFQTLSAAAAAAAVRSNIGLEDKASILRNASPLGQPAPHETRENKSVGENNEEKIFHDNSRTTTKNATGSQAEGSRVVDSTGAKTTQNGGLLSPGEKFGPEQMSNGMGLNGNLHCSSNLKVKESLGAFGSSNTVTSQVTKRPPLRKSVSISCEKELYKTPGDHENEANGNGNSSKIENKSARPKTAVTLSSRSSKTPPGKTDGAQAIITSHSQRARSLNSQISTTNRSPSPSIKTSTVGCRTAVKPNTKENDKIESVISECTNNGSNKNQASKNRKILIKKALIEINQSSSHFQKKWGVLGRPKTAPSSNNNPHGPPGEKSKKSGLMTMLSSGSGPTTSHKRQPLKASQPLNGVKPGQVVGKQVTSGNPGEEDGESSEADGKEEGTMNKDATGSVNEHIAARKSLHRQSFSLDEGLLLGFSNKEFGWKTQDQDEEPVPSKTETLFQNSKKREECLKIYDKMMKTGLSVKLDTILRGMMTPSEYRVFIKAAENAAREAAAAKEEAEAAMAKESLELNENESDAGVSEAIGVNTKTHEAVQA